jgi:hypothetical protein
MILPHVLNADSEATLEAGTASTSRAMLPSIGNLAEFTAHHFRMSKSGVWGWNASSR